PPCAITRPKKRCQPANNLSKPPKNRRLWTGTRLRLLRYWRLKPLLSLHPCACCEHRDEEIKQAAAGIPNLNRPQPPTCSTLASIRSMSSSDRPK
ncbi:hypothetical protein CN179_26985, partial [Sinorhizobium medicae]